ncbi:MAG: APC family permease [Christensenellales bacterium]|jgi:APA family basic amino acid/polyamine antiporter
MQNELKRKYGLPTAISMVVGIIIGSGIFFKAQKVLAVSEGSLPISVLAWVIGGLIMIVCSLAFANLASKYERVNGIVDYAEVAVGSKYGYLIGWFMTTIYYPSLTSVLAWVSARYFCELFGMDITGGGCLAIAAFFMSASYGLNALSPKLAGKFQVSTTIIKLIPLIVVGVLGTVVGLANGLVVQNFSAPVLSSETFSAGSALFTSICATAFAYEGWIIATSINSELVDGKKNLPKALIGGALIVISVYILYNVGLFGAVERDVVLNEGTTPAFSALFGNAGAVVVRVLIVVSCLGTLNGLMLGCTRGLYSLAARGTGPKPDMFRQVDAATNMPSNSSIMGLVLTGFWLMYFYGANLTDAWFGPFSFDSSELPIITLYAAYIPIFIMTMKKERDMKPFARYGVNTLAIIGCVFMMIAAVVSHKMAVVYYLILFVIIMLIGMLFARKNGSK